MSSSLLCAEVEVYFKTCVHPVVLKGYHECELHLGGMHAGRLAVRHIQLGIIVEA